MKPVTEKIEVVSYNPQWPEIYNRECALIRTATSEFIAFEHIGSTAIPEQRAKPIIDMMASVESLQTIDTLLDTLSTLGYNTVETGMHNRLFLRKHNAESEQVFHLHIVEHATWDERKERLIRYYLLAHPEVVKAYGELKDSLAIKYALDPLAYTEAKTGFIQGIIDKARDKQGLPRIAVWES
jgi:GrpB-like predicted nucleotidyltransferase (UPF0157 family)